MTKTLIHIFQESDGLEKSMLMVMLSFLHVACTDPPKDTGAPVALPEEEVVEEDSAMGWFTVDTAMDTGYNEPMEQYIEIIHQGEWELTPVSQPYLALFGTLHVQEYANDNFDEPWCDFEFSLTGIATDDMCDTCDFAFDVEFYVVEEEVEEGAEEEEDDDDDIMDRAISPEYCFTPDIPEHLESRRLAYSSLERIIYFDYYNSGFWVPWYGNALQVHETINFDWSSVVGFYRYPEEVN